jgi:hypothetical protein
MARSRVVAKNKREKIITRLIVCEGYEDGRFFDRLIKERGLHFFKIIHGKGNTDFHNALDSFRIDYPIAYSHIKHVLFIADNDESPDKRFELVCKQIENRFGKQFVPDAPLRAKGRNPSVQVLMSPWTKINGHIEALCVKAARYADKKGGADVDNFMAIIHADKWNSDSRRGKAWLRTNFAIRCDKDPFISMGDAISDAKYSYLIDFHHESFNDISDYLKSVGG